MEQDKVYIPSEIDWREAAIGSYDSNPMLAEEIRGTSTMIVRKGEQAAIVLPYRNGSVKLTDAAERVLNNMNRVEDDIWGYLKSMTAQDGVYMFNTNILEHGSDLDRKGIMEDRFSLTRLGHEDYVHSDFAQPTDRIARVIDQTFEKGKKVYGYDEMMGFLLPEASKNVIIERCCVNSLGAGASMVSRNSDIYGLADNEISYSKQLEMARVELGGLEKATKALSAIRSVIENGGRIDSKSIEAAKSEYEDLKKFLTAESHPMIAIGNYLSYIPTVKKNTSDENDIAVDSAIMASYYCTEESQREIFAENSGIDHSSLTPDESKNEFRKLVGGDKK